MNEWMNELILVLTVHGGKGTTREVPDYRRIQTSVFVKWSRKGKKICKNRSWPCFPLNLHQASTSWLRMKQPFLSNHTLNLFLKCVTVLFKRPSFGHQLISAFLDIYSFSWKGCSLLIMFYARTKFWIQLLTVWSTHHMQIKKASFSF